MIYFAFFKQQSTLLEFMRCHNFTLMILMASSCSDPFPSSHCSCFQQDPKTWKTAISPAKCSDNCNDRAQEKSDTLQHYCITALNRSQMTLHSRVPSTSSDLPHTMARKGYEGMAQAPQLCLSISQHSWLKEAGKLSCDLASRWG